jgi:N6-adenosine-specific RNA methylase IME4
MNMLAQYDAALSALAKALASTDVRVVLASRDELDHVKLHAKRVRDRQLLADATEYQMRVERWLGMLLERAEEAGYLRKSGERGRACGRLDDVERPATLKDIGIDKKLSMKSRKAAALELTKFDAVVADMRAKMASGKAILVDPIDQAAKTAELEGRRAAHAVRALAGGGIEDLHALARSGRKFKSIGMDPQWKFLTRSPLGDGRSANVHYRTEEVDRIKQLPVEALAAEDCALYMWMVDWCPQDALDLIAHYGFKHITTAFTWVKLTTSGQDVVGQDRWHMGQGYWTRANPEDCWFATRGHPKRLHADVRQLIVAPVMEHSRKPDEWLERIERLTEGDYLELQARRTRPGWMSWGDELEFTGEAA